MSSDIENLLRRMPLRKPSADLDARVLASRPQPKRAWLIGAVGGALAAAAAVILAVGLPQNTHTVTTAPPAVPGATQVAEGPLTLTGAAPAVPAEPVRLEQNWSEVSYEGLVCPDPQTPLRKFRHRTLEHVQWFDPRRNIRMETTIPHEEIIFVKASVE